MSWREGRALSCPCSALLHVLHARFFTLGDKKIKYNARLTATVCVKFPCTRLSNSRSTLVISPAPAMQGRVPFWREAL